MLRGILGVLAGLVVGVLVVAVIQNIGHRIFPPPDNLDHTNPEVFAEIIKSMPLGAKLFVTGSYFAGALIGASVALLVSARRHWAAIATTTILFLFGMVTVITIPHPIWMIVGTVLANAVGLLLARILFGPKEV